MGGVDVSTGATVIIVEIPVVTTLAATAVAWIVRRFVSRVDEHESELSTQAGLIAAHELRLTADEALISNHERRIPTMSENLAILAAFVERHERWHERHDSTTHNNDPA